MRAPDGLTVPNLYTDFRIDEVAIAREVMAERVRVFTDRSVSGALSSPFGTLLLAAIIGPGAGWQQAAIWLVLINLGELLILGFGYRYRAVQPEARNSHVWARYQIGANAATGLAWGGSIWIMAVDPLSPLYLFNICVLVGVSALCVSIMSAFRLGMLLFALGVLLPPVLHVFWISHPQAAQIGSGLLILLALELYYGRFARRQLIHGLDAAQRSRAQVAQLSQLRGELFESNQQLAEKNADLGQALERLNELATRDELTGAFNRRIMVEYLERQVVYKSRYGTPASLLMFDLDHFKNINDTHGHLVGDQALQALVRTVSGELREGDILARFGGEEFLVLLPMAPREAASQLAERLRCAISAIDLRDGNTSVPLRASFGVAELAADEGVAGWLRRVDLAMYRAKESGRDRVINAE